MGANTQLEFNFLSHFPTHSTVWNLLECVGYAYDNPYQEELIEKGIAFRDRKGTVWLIVCNWFPTKEKAEAFPKAGHRMPYQVQMTIQLSN